uniref:Uncharacterized protein n=1 Tax=Arundo donax TaxID=35708 RepID=A0A0A9A7G8_ARUDO
MSQMYQNVLFIGDFSFSNRNTHNSRVCTSVRCLAEPLHCYNKSPLLGISAL